MSKQVSNAKKLLRSKFKRGKRRGKSRSKRNKDDGDDKGGEEYSFDDFVEDFGEDLPDLSDEQKNIIRDGIANGIDFFTNPKLQDVQGWVTFVQGNLGTLGSLGVPGMDGAAQLLGGVYALIDEARQRKGIEDAANAGLKAADETFRDVAAAVTELAETSAFLLLEVYDIMSSEEPPAGVSSIESTSRSLWRDVQARVVRFFKTSEMYADFTDAVSGRRLLLEGSESAAALPASAMLKMRATTQTSLAPPRSSAQLQRALNEKEGCDQVVPLAQRGLAELDQYLHILDRVVLFGETMHDSMVELVQTSRDLRVARLESKINGESESRWVDAADRIKIAASASDGAISDFFLDFKDVMDQFRLTVPELTVVKGAAVAERIEKLVSEAQDGVVREACAQAWYQALEAPASCSSNLAQVFSTTDPKDGLSAFINTVKADVSNAILNAPVQRDDWVRFPVMSALEVATLASNGSLSAETVVTLDLTRRIGTECGTRAEVLAVTAVLENLADEGRPVILDDWVGGSPTFVPIDVQPRGPFIKIDEQGRRHAFRIADVQDPAGHPTIVTAQSCSEVAEDEYVATRLPSDFRLCIKNPRVELDPTPLLAKYDITLGPYAKVIESHLDSVYLQLALYIKVSANDVKPSCKIPASLGFALDGGDRPGDGSGEGKEGRKGDSEASESDTAGLSGGAGAAIGVFVTLAVVAAVVGFVAIKQRRNTASGLSEHSSNPEPALAIANPSIGKDVAIV